MRAAGRLPPCAAQELWVPLRDLPETASARSRPNPAPHITCPAGDSTCPELELLPFAYSPSLWICRLAVCTQCSLLVKSKGKSNPKGSYPLRPCSGSQETREEKAAVRDSERTWQQFRHSLIAETCFLSSLLAFSVPLPTTPRKKPLSGKLEVGWFQDRSWQRSQKGHRPACERLRDFSITSAPSRPLGRCCLPSGSLLLSADSCRVARAG